NDEKKRNEKYSKKVLIFFSHAVTETVLFLTQYKNPYTGNTSTVRRSQLRMNVYENGICSKVRRRLKC
ncbi:hypothetical protein NL476_27560, partial [Klebsiella pneumoniae]|nr:hypothetical protein [Klebsiella pneumoniae]